MYSIDTEVRYKIYDICSGNESNWLSNMNEVKKNLKKMIYRYVGRRPIHDNDLLSYIKFNFNEKKEARFIYSSELDFCYSSEIGAYTYLYHRIFVIIDNYGRMLPPNKLPGVYYDYRMCQYRFKDSNKNESNDLIGHYGHRRNQGLSRNSSMFKDRLIHGSDDQVIEYKDEYSIKARNLCHCCWSSYKNAWISRSWKDQTKYRCQWMANEYRKRKTDSDINF